MLGGFSTIFLRLSFLLLGLHLCPSLAWAGSHLRLDDAQVSPAGPLARGASVQLEAGFVAAWAGNLPPDPPAALGSDAYVLGDATNAAKGAFRFTLADPDPGDRLRAVVEVSTRSDFGLLVTSMTTPSVIGGLVEAEVGPLSEGRYFWRVKARDATGAESSWSAPAGGAMAFAVDDTPPQAGLDILAGPVRAGGRRMIRGWVAGEDVIRWRIQVGNRQVANGDLGQPGRKIVETEWVVTEPEGVVAVMLVAEDVEGYRAAARTPVTVAAAPASRPEAAAPATPALAEDAFGFRSAGLGPNPARAGARVACHLAVGRADEVRAAWYSVAGEAVGLVEATSPVWHTDGLCYESGINTASLAAGVYLVVLDARRDGQAPVRVVRKLVVVH